MSDYPETIHVDVDTNSEWIVDIMPRCRCKGEMKVENLLQSQGSIMLAGHCAACGQELAINIMCIQNKLPGAPTLEGWMKKIFE